ncbi:MAG: twin-arginine translocation signal domain-containing protein, partial [Planctomycetota bacterium]
MPKTTRRKFLKDSLVAGTAFAVCGTKSTARSRANNRLRIAVAGVNSRGGSHMKGWLDQDNV